MTNKPIRVLVVDDHLLIRRGLAALLLTFTDLMLIGEAQNGAEALELCASAHPDIVLMDLLMPMVDGVAATQVIRQRYPNIQVILLTNCDEYDMVRRALAAGAESYVLKSAKAGELASEIREAHYGHTPRVPISIGDMAPAPQAPFPDMPSSIADLTSREHEVLERMAHGLTNTQIGANLNISRATAKFHVSNILSKLGVMSRTEAVALAVQHHLASTSG